MLLLWHCKNIQVFQTNKIVGMAGILDSSRFKYFLSQELSVPVKTINTLVLGGHGDTMVPMPNRTTINNKPLNQIIEKEKLNSIIDRTRKGGAEIVKIFRERICILCTSCIRRRNGRILY